MLQVTSEQEAVMAYYYMDDNNKVQVTEIFDVTDTESHAVLSVEEVENNTKLQFDEWDEPTWLSQHTFNDGNLLHLLTIDNFITNIALTKITCIIVKNLL